ncbi:MAG TPA: HEAT repeat domain-containing protein, partial [candidate division Zixibacteria bacterium]|nr:HEAT repeat domain-containing protein [candidate division Zixibacteria bacterium]
TVYKDICKLLEFHPEYETISQALDSYMSCGNVLAEITNELKTPSVRIKNEAQQSIDSLMQETFSDLSIEFSPALFTESFVRLIKTGQKEKSAEVAIELVEYLENSNNDFRQKALSLLLEIIAPLHLYSDKYLFDKLSQVIIRNLFEKKETFEYSEFVWQIIEKSIVEKDYKFLAKIMHSLYLRRRIENDVTIYDSIAIKKIYMNFNQKSIIDGLITELLKGNSSTNQYLKEVLIGSGSEEVAVALVNIISHPNRQIRQLALKILGELGHASLDVFGAVLADDDLFKREEGKRELPDEQWYIVRNAIFVFGLLKDIKGCIPLRLRINDPDVRVRREIISALEKIGGEESVDVLMMMADDDDREIREAAVITIGLIGTEDVSPLLIALAQQNLRVVIKALHALGRVGGKEAEKYLSLILNDDDLLESLTSSKVSKEEIRLATIKALGDLDDSQAIQTIKQYHAGQSTTQKIFFKNSPINKTIKNILSKK